MPDLMSSMFTRRTFLAGAGAAAAGSLLAACGGGSQSGPSNPTGPLKFFAWQYHPEIIQSNIKGFEQMYGQKVQSSILPYDQYYTSMQTHLTGGERPDQTYAETSYMYRWAKAGWIRSVDDITATQSAASYKSRLYPANLEMMSVDGKLMGLPYYSGYVSFIYNKDHLQKANLTPATSWDELMDQLRKLKRDGISDRPFTMAWQVTPAALSWALTAIMYSEGEYLFGKDLKPTFQDSPTWTKQLQMLKTMFDEQLVPADALVAAQESVPDFGAGGITYMLVHDYDQQALNTESGSFKTAPGKVGNALLPGKTRETYSWTTMILMAAGLSGQRLTDAWNMMQYFGGLDKDGKSAVNKRWALETGLGNPYKELNQDPDITAAWGKWRDMSVHVKQLEKTRGRPIEKTLWFPEWDQYVMQAVQGYLQGKSPVGKVTKDIYDQYKTLVKKYP